MISFNHIRHGNYILKVKATNSHGIWSKYIAELPIEVRPTFWESIWGKIVLILILFVIVGTIFYTYNQRQRENLSHNISIMKNEFFSDASHRLRTPLTLIGGPISQVLANEPGLTKQSRELLQIVDRNAKEMLEMINKVLKFDNNSNFYVNGGLDEVNETDEQVNEVEEGQINDQNVQLYLEEKEKEKQEEAERMEEHNIEKEDKQKEITILVVEDNNDLRKYIYNIERFVQCITCRKRQSRSADSTKEYTRLYPHRCYDAGNGWYNYDSLSEARLSSQEYTNPCTIS